MTNSDEHDAYDPLTPVPQGQRRLTARDAFSLWFSLGIGLLVLQAGAGLVPGLSFAGALIAIVIGSVAGAVLLALAGVIGCDTGLAGIAALRPTLGVRGAAVAAVVNVIQLVGWGAFEIVAMRDAASQLSHQAFGFTLPVLWTLIFGAAATGLAFLGPLSFVRRFLRHWGMWLLLAGAAWLTWSLLSRHDLMQIVSAPGKGGLGLGAAIDLVVVMPLSWLPLIADYSRFGVSSRAMFKGSAAGYALANIWFYALGAAFALIARDGSGDLLVSALATTGGGLALLLILIDETDNIFADIFSAATSTGTLVAVPVRRLALGFGAVCTLIALFVALSRFMDFLYMIGAVFTPLYGVLLIDHFVVRQRRVVAGDISDLQGVYRFTAGVHISAFAAWAVGIAAYYYFLTYLPQAGATLPAFFLAAVSYWGLSQSFAKPVA